MAGRLEPQRDKFRRAAEDRGCQRVGEPDRKCPDPRRKKFRLHQHVNGSESAQHEQPGETEHEHRHRAFRAAEGLEKRNREQRAATRSERM